MARLWPGISPHGPSVPTSVWNLPFNVWVAIAGEVDDYIRQSKKVKR